MLSRSLVVWASLSIAVIGCTTNQQTGSGSNENDAGASAPTNGATDCALQMALIDPVRNCSVGLAPATGLCKMTTDPAYKGLYTVCFVSPSGQIFIGVTSDGVFLSGDGWTFSESEPTDRQHLPRPTPQAQASCDAALSATSPTGTPPPCSGANGDSDAAN